MEIENTREIRSVHEAVITREETIVKWWDAAEKFLELVPGALILDIAFNEGFITVLYELEND